jgi:chitodextrinase
MLLRHRRVLLALLFSVTLAACGGKDNSGDSSGSGSGSSGSTSSGGSSSSSGTGSTVAVTIAPTSVSLAIGSGTQLFTAAVSNSSDASVTWSVGGVTGGNASVGTITTGGVYSAPSSLPSPPAVAVMAAANADPSKTATATVTLTQSSPPVPTVPTGLAATAIATGSITLTWTASTESQGTGVGGYAVYRNGTLIATTTATGYTDSPLRALTSYSYQVAAFDRATPANVSALSAPLSVTTLADTQAPMVPTGLAAAAIATGSITLSWSASTDLPSPGGTGVGGYYVYRNGARIATVTGTSYVDSPLTASTAYSYQVAAFDQATPPNVSAMSAALSASTLADTQAPTVPTGLAATSVTLSSITLGWNASTDLPNPGATGVGGYYIYRNGTQIGTATTTSYTDSPLAAATSYSYQLAAFDRATPPNLSALSAALSITTANAITITPRNSALTLSQTQQFAASAPGSTVTWSVDGTVGGSSSVGTVSTNGLYTPPATPGTHTVTATYLSYSASAAVAVTDLSAITTYHNDVARTGQNLQEYALTPATVAGAAFGKLWSCPLDGSVYAQPLYVANLSIGGGTHNVLIVATMHDSVYAFDADNPGCVTYWHTSLIYTSAGITSTNPGGCADIVTEIGITGTPVIDPASQTIYLVASTTESGNYVQRLHALSLATGAEQANSPVAIVASVTGTGDGASSVSFNPQYANQRAGLALADGEVFIAWSSHCDQNSWHGWVMSYDETLLSQSAVFNSTPNGSAGGIWMAGGAPAIDAAGNMFVPTGNGTFDDTHDLVPPAAPLNDFGESFVNLNPTTLAVQDFYTPSQSLSWSAQDLDLASAGVVVLPDGMGPAAHPNVLIGSDKQGHLWMIDRTQMSQFSSSANNTVQYLTLPNIAACLNDEQCVYATPAYWSGIVYVAIEHGPLMALPLASGLLPASAEQVAQPSSQSQETYGFPAPTPAISAAPSGGAIAWVLDTSLNGTDGGGSGPAILRAYDATNLGSTLYSSATLAADAAGNATKFAVPVIANGHVYVAGNGTLTVYGLAP